MAWMDHYEAAELRKGRVLEDLFGPEYEDLYEEPEHRTDPDGWEYRGDTEFDGYWYAVRHLGDFQAFVVRHGIDYEVFARGPAGLSTRRTVLPDYPLDEAKAYAMELMDGLRARLLDGARAC